MQHHVLLADLTFKQHDPKRSCRYLGPLLALILSYCLRHCRLDYGYFRDGDHGDVVFLTESLCGLRDLCRRAFSANQFQDALEAEELALFVRGFSYTVRKKQKPVSFRHEE